MGLKLPIKNFAPRWPGAGCRSNGCMNPQKNKLLLVYPHMGLSGNFVRHAPLSLLYTSIEVIEAGYGVELLDNRLHLQDWKEVLAQKLADPSLLAVGVSVMTGKPILNAIEVSEFAKEKRPDLPVIWGGPHPTFYPETPFTFTPACDYVISGYGSKPLALLTQALAQGTRPDQIAGLYLKQDGQLRSWPPAKQFEYINYKKIPYHLIPDYGRYGQLEDMGFIFSMYSVYGCPYKCTFCSTPAALQGYARKWERVDVVEVVDHIQFLVDRYQASYIYFIDDDSFVNLQHVESIIDEISRRGLKVRLGFRGARINEIKKMSDDFLSKLANAGTNILHIGAESGSNQMLELFKKNCTVEDIIECNQKLARHKEITAGYNFIVGIPGETLTDLKQTRDLILRLIEDNPRAIIFTPNRFRPLPGTELFDYASANWKFTPPSSVGQWVEVEVEGNYRAPWETQETREFCNLLVLGSYFIDQKIFKVTSGKNAMYRILRLFSWAYSPFSNLRFRRGWYQFYWEFFFYQKAPLLLRLLSK